MSGFCRSAPKKSAANIVGSGRHGLMEPSAAKVRESLVLSTSTGGSTSSTCHVKPPENESEPAGRRGDSAREVFDAVKSELANASGGASPSATSAQLKTEPTPSPRKGAAVVVTAETRSSIPIDTPPLSTFKDVERQNNNEYFNSLGPDGSKPNQGT